VRECGSGDSVMMRNSFLSDEVVSWLFLVVMTVIVLTVESNVDDNGLVADLERASPHSESARTRALVWNALTVTANEILHPPN
jgi:hypothetical protein